MDRIAAPRVARLRQFVERGLQPGCDAQQAAMARVLLLERGLCRPGRLLRRGHLGHHISSGHGARELALTRRGLEQAEQWTGIRHPRTLGVGEAQVLLLAVEEEDAEDHNGNEKGPRDDEGLGLEPEVTEQPDARRPDAVVLKKAAHARLALWPVGLTNIVGLCGGLRVTRPTCGSLGDCAVHLDLSEMKRQGTPRGAAVARLQ